MRQTRILIVEDEIIIADSIRSVLLDMNYAVPEPCNDYNEAMEMLATKLPDLAILDINLGGNDKDGIAIGAHIRQNMHMPFIFLTANSDAGTLERAKEVTPNAFLVKPFRREDLFAAIEIALHNFSQAASSIEAVQERSYVYIKEGTQQYKVELNDILYLESDHVYVSVHTRSRKYLVRTSLQQYLEELGNKIFARIHRGYAVNKHKIDKLGPSQLVIGGTTLPISKKYKEALDGSL